MVLIYEYLIRTLLCIYSLLVLRAYFEVHLTYSSTIVVQWIGRETSFGDLPTMSMPAMRICPALCSCICLAAALSHPQPLLLTDHLALRHYLEHDWKQAVFVRLQPPNMHRGALLFTVSA